MCGHVYVEQAGVEPAQVSSDFSFSSVDWLSYDL